MGVSPVAFPESIAKARERWTRRAEAQAADRPPDEFGREAERESARGARGGAARALVWGHRKRAARAEHARALDGSPGLFDGLAASLYGSAVDSLAMALATVGGVGRVPV